MLRGFVYNSGMNKPPSPNHLWYVYAYLDPRPEKDSDVIYVGKGTQREGHVLKRMRTHLHHAEHPNKLFARVLAKIKTAGLEPVTFVLEWFDSERGALDAEIANIAKYKLRRDGGTLCNLTYGGEGTVGYQHEDDAKKMISVRSKEFWQDPEYVAKRNASQREYIENNPDAIAQQAAKTRAAWTDEKRVAHSESVKARGPEFGAKISESLRSDPERLAQMSVNAKTVLQTPEVIAKRKVTLKATMGTPEFRKALSERIKNALSTPEAKANKSEATRRMWESDEYRGKMAEARGNVSQETRAKLSTSMKEAIANMDPETKAKLSAFRSQMAKERHARNALLNPKPIKLVKVAKTKRLAQTDSVVL